MTVREGSLEAPTRHALDWKNPAFYDEAALNKELERVFDICHGCRRCVSLCGSFPTLFELIDRHDDQDAGRLTPAEQDRVVDECASALLVAVEAPPYGIQGQRGVIDSAGFRWLLYDRLLSAGRTVVEVNVTAVKIYATGRGNTSGPTKVTKADMVAAVRATYGRVFDIPSGRGAGDVADAVTLAALAARATGLAIDTLPPSHTRALTGARWPTPALA
jgi:Fe-S oxidoreductase